MTNEELEIFYREHLEEDISLESALKKVKRPDILFIYNGKNADFAESYSKKKNISLEKAMETYYQSNLANLIHDGEYGIQYLDYTLLTEILEKECHD